MGWVHHKRVHFLTLLTFILPNIYQTKDYGCVPANPNEVAQKPSFPPDSSGTIGAAEPFQLPLKPAASRRLAVQALQGSDQVPLSVLMQNTILLDASLRPRHVPWKPVDAPDAKSLTMCQRRAAGLPLTPAFMMADYEPSEKQCSSFLRCMDSSIGLQCRAAMNAQQLVRANGLPQHSSQSDLRETLELLATGGRELIIVGDSVSHGFRKEMICELIHSGAKVVNCSSYAAQNSHSVDGEYHGEGEGRCALLWDDGMRLIAPTFVKFVATGPDKVYDLNALQKKIIDVVGGNKAMILLNGGVRFNAYAKYVHDCNAGLVRASDGSGRMVPNTGGLGAASLKDQTPFTHRPKQVQSKTTDESFHRRTIGDWLEWLNELASPGSGFIGVWRETGQQNFPTANGVWDPHVGKIKGQCIQPEQWRANDRASSPRVYSFDADFRNRVAFEEMDSRNLSNVYVLPVHRSMMWGISAKGSFDCTHPCINPLIQHPAYFSLRNIAAAVLASEEEEKKRQGR